MRYREILNEKIEEEKRIAAKQEKLKEANGISGTEVVIRKRTGKHLLISILIGALNTVRLLLAAIGVLVLIDPALRESLVATIQSMIQ